MLRVTLLFLHLVVIGFAGCTSNAPDGEAPTTEVVAETAADDVPKPVEPPSPPQPAVAGKLTIGDPAPRFPLNNGSKENHSMASSPGKSTSLSSGRLGVGLVYKTCPT